MISLAEPYESIPGTQTLARGLMVLEAVGQGDRTLGAIASRVGYGRSTTQRLASALTRAGWLSQSPDGYRLGTRLMELGFLAQQQSPLTALARPHLEALALETRDTVHLGIRDGADVVYLDKIASRRGLEMRSRVGHRMRLALTGVGRALMLDLPPPSWRSLFDTALADRQGDATRPAWPLWLARMRDFVAVGIVFDREENELGVCCVAVPVRDAAGGICAAISVAGASPYMPEERMQSIAADVRAAAQAVSARLGWTGASADPLATLTEDQSCA